LAGDKEGDGATTRTGEEDEGAVHAGAEDEGEACRPLEGEDEGAAACAGETRARVYRTRQRRGHKPHALEPRASRARTGAEDKDEDPLREPEKRARSDWQRTAGVAAWQSAWRGSGGA
jgi:hypothetical protein